MLITIKKKHWLLALSAAMLAALLAATTAFAEGEEPPAAPAAEETTSEAPDAPAAPAPAESEPAPQAEPAPPAEEPAAEPAAEAPEPAAPIEEPAAEQPAAEAETPPADENSPQAEPEAEAAEEAAPEEPTAEEAAHEEPAAEELPAETGAIDTAPEAEAPAAEVLAEIAAEAAENGVALADGSGEELTLTETSSAELISSGDPYYKIGLNQYSFYAGEGACVGDTSYYCEDGLGWDVVIQAALNHMANTGLPSDRKLYVQAGTYGGFTINAFNDDYLALLSGVIGESGSGSTFITSDVNIQGTTGGFTLSGFTLNTGGKILFDNNKGSLKIEDVTVTDSSADNDYGLKVDNHAGAVTLESVNVSGSKRSGATINNNPGSYPVTIKNSAFNGNGWDYYVYTHYFGLIIQSNGSISIEGVSASNNNGTGIWLEDSSSSSKGRSLKNVVLYENNHYSYNPSQYGYGLYIKTNGTASTTLEQVYALNNDWGMKIEGGSLNAKYIEVSNNDFGNGLHFSSTTGSSKIEYSQFLGNFGDNLYIKNKGAITLNSIQSNESQHGHGAYLDNYLGGSGAGNVTITSPASGGWQQANNFNTNFYGGVSIQSRGSVLISNFDIYENGGSGLDVDNTGGSGSVTVNATIKNWQNTCNANGLVIPDEGGVTISSKGTVKLGYLDADDNRYTGIDIRTEGGIELLNVSSANNSFTGAYLDNQNAATAKTVKLTNSSFDHNQGAGIEVISKGGIELLNVYATNNSGKGAFLDNQNATTANTVKLTNSSFDHNQSTGIEVISKGGIELLNVSSANNLFKGAYLDNQGAATAKTVKLTNSSFNHNQGNGIEVYSKGGITAYGLAASGNSLRETSIYNVEEDYHDLLGESWVEDRYTFDHGEGGPINLYLKSNDFDPYLELYDSDGNLEASGYANWVNGAKIEGLSMLPAGKYTVVVKSYESSGFGEYWFSFGNETMSEDVQQIKGAILDNSSGRGAAVAIYKPKDLNRLWGNTFSYNTWMGIEIISNGSILLESVSADGNFLNGVRLDNTASTAAVTVSNTRTDGFSSSFSDNGGYGVQIDTKGNVTLKNISANRNRDWGMAIDNCQADSGGKCTGIGGVKVQALKDIDNSFCMNGENGLKIESGGAVALTNIYAGENVGKGLWVNNAFEEASGAVSLTSLGTDWYNEFSYNHNNGLVITSNGSILLSRLSVHANQLQSGAILDNSGSGTSAGVSITSGWFSYNQAYGLKVNTLGAILWQYGGADSNGQAGALLDNKDGSKGITVKGSKNNIMSFISNYSDYGEEQGGLEALSSGKITLAYAYAEGNNGHGLLLNNDTSTSKQMIDISAVEVYDNSIHGLYANSRGAISLKGISAWENNDYGAYLFNDYENSSGAVTVTTTTGWSDNGLWKNGDSGLKIESRGSVSLTNIDAWDNGGDGVAVQNTNGTGTVTYKSSGHEYSMSDNDGYGLYINTHGKVTVSNQYGLNAHRNTGVAGVFIDNSYAPAGSMVSISKVFASGNSFGNGISVLAQGNISATSLTANDNGKNPVSEIKGGAKLVSAGGSVTLSGSNYFNDNSGIGLHIGAKLAVSVSNISSQRNQEEGVTVESSDDGNITVTNVLSTNNGNSGLYLQSDGNFNLNKVVSFLNGQKDNGGMYDDGLSIKTESDTSTVKIANSSFMNNWNGSGIEIEHPKADDPDEPFWPTLINTSYLGNNNTNLFVHQLIS